MKQFEKDIINVLYDADEDCLEQIKASNRHLKSQLHVLPYALSDKCKSSVLNINYDYAISKNPITNAEYVQYLLEILDETACEN